MNEPVLDSSAILALLNGEAGADAVRKRLSGAALSAVNLSEVVSTLADRGMPVELARSALLGLGIQVHPFDAEMAVAAGSLRTVTRALGLSLGDRACLALAQVMNRPVLTADRAWKRLSLGIRIEVLR